MHKATVLVIDGGGRGSVLVDKYLQSPHVAKVLAIPGNDLMLSQNKKKVVIFPQIKTTDVDQIASIAKREKIDLVDVVQDDAVAVGVTDTLLKGGFKVFGPTKTAGQIEWDKAFARRFMEKFDIPTPAFKICKSEQDGIKFIKSRKESEWYVKASGLAAGKGALYAKDNSDAIEKIHEMKNFGKSGEIFLIEECLRGEEFSSFAIVDGPNFIVVGHAQDHKQVYDGNLGPNTGGMGCSSPPMVINSEMENQIKSIFQKTVEGLAKMDRPYRGILYLGGMIDVKGNVWVIEFNARWGDPEAQVIIPAIKDDFFQLASYVLNNQFNKIKIRKDNTFRIVVAATSRGYPEDYKVVIGKRIFGLDRLLDYSAPSLRHPDPELVEGKGSIKIFGAGVKISNGQYLVNGGRLFYVVGQGKNVAQARQKTYNALSLVYVEGNNLHYRTDIGFRDLERFYDL